MDAGLDVALKQVAVVPRGTAPARADVPHLDRVERLTRRVDDVIARGCGLAAPEVPAWLAEAGELLAARSVAGDHDRARLHAARAGVLLARTSGDAAAARDDAAEAARLFELSGDALGAATGSAVAALAAVRAGAVGQALDDAVQALVAFGSLPDGERDPDGEATLAELLGELCSQFFDADRALQFYELAARSLRGLPAGAPRDARLARTQTRIAALALAQARDAGRPGRGALLRRAAGIVRTVLDDLTQPGAQRREGEWLLAAVYCEQGRWAEGLDLLGPPTALAAAGAGPDGALVRLTRARCLDGLGDPAAALPDVDAAVVAFAASGDLAQHIDALGLRSRVRERTGDTPGALDDARALADLLWQRHRRQVGGFMDQVWSRAGVEGQRRDLEARARVLLRFAEQDSLTGLANRRAMERFCTSLRASEPVCLVLVDVDHFKDVNDRHGHLVGDVVLREVAAVLSGSVRSVDRVARWGGEEFLVALPGGSAVLGAEAAGRLRRRIEQHAWSSHAPGLRLTVSAGVSAGAAAEFATVLARADAAVYAAKAAGRNRVVTS